MQARCVSPCCVQTSVLFVHRDRWLWLSTTAGCMQQMLMHRLPVNRLIQLGFDAKVLGRRWSQKECPA